MLKHIIQPLINLFLVFLIFFLTNASADNLTLPENENFLKIQADSVEFDDQQGKAIYRGHVIMEQGLMRVTSETLILLRDTKGKIKSILATGHPAHFTQNGDTISGNSLTYDVDTQVLSSKPIPGNLTTIHLSPKETKTNE